ncbi:MAG: Crp/Fnr family transcriptional regulator [Thermohalobaculum sp.]|nr:Crp/Fnr family transcriptional regulator [Thermohalobaculum sp.]
MSGSERMIAPNLRKAHERCADCGIRTRAVCSYCGPQDLQLLDAIKFYKTYDPGQEIVAAGERTDFLGSVVEGVVSLCKTMPDGRRQMVGLMFPSDFVGRPMRPIAPYDAVAVTPVKLCLFHRSRFERLLKDTPSLEKRLLEMTLDELDAARDWMLLLGRKTAREKIATFLAILTRRAAGLDNTRPHDGLRFELPLTREQMADYLGLTIETVSRQITGLKKDGVVEFADARSCHVPDFVALLDAAGEDADGGMIG